MLETFFVRPETVERIRASWIGSEVERYANWLADQGYGARTVWRRVPQVLVFGEYARERGAQVVADLPAHLDAYVRGRVSGHRGQRKNGSTAQQVAKEVRGPVEQLLRLVVPGFTGAGRGRRHEPFGEAVPGFFAYLVAERGLRPDSVRHYAHHLQRLEAYLGRVGVRDVQELSPALLSAFVAERSATGLAKTSVRDGCGVLRVFLRYAHREGLVGRDLSRTVEWPQVYRLSSIPRSISWTEVGRVLAGVDPRTACGKRDYAILLLLVTYGLRGREVAALTLDDIDWKRERLAVPERKAGHSTASHCPKPSVRRSSIISSTADRQRRIGTCFSGRQRRCDRSDPLRSPPVQHAICCGLASRFLGQAPTRCATRSCSGSSISTLG